MNRIAIDSKMKSTVFQTIAKDGNETFGPPLLLANWVPEGSGNCSEIAKMALSALKAGDEVYAVRFRVPQHDKANEVVDRWSADTELPNFTEQIADGFKYQMNLSVECFGSWKLEPRIKKKER